MRFTIKREEFLKGLVVASRAVASKVAVAVLANLKIELNENGLFITGSNYDLTIKTQVPYKLNGLEIIRNYKEGATLINSKLITEIARKMESEEITFDVIDSTIATISDNRSEYKLNCVRPDEYPDLDLAISFNILLVNPSKCVMPLASSSLIELIPYLMISGSDIL